MVSGEAGIGKTALLDAFTTRLPHGTRVLRGSCDPIVPSRPFAPVVDISAHVGGGLRTALAAGDRDGVFEQFLALLRSQRAGAVVIFEDLHWADSATLDLLRVVGRRLPETAVLLVGTYRGHEVLGEHPLRLALGDMPSANVSNLVVPPLTVAAVGSLVAGTGLDAKELHETTGGNPFFVTEVIASGGGTLPPTVRDAVAARVARLTETAQQILRAAAVLGSRVEPELVMAVARGPSVAEGLRECLAREVLRSEAGRLSFRHELARRAVLDAMSPMERARLHGRALVALRSGIVPASTMRLAEHAIEAGDTDAIGSLAPQAAEDAAALGAHGEAADYLAIAVALEAAVDDRSRGELLERYAYECSVSDRVAAARSAQESALAIWRDLGDERREGDGLRALSTYLWLSGEGDRAREVAESAVRVLEGVAPHSREMAQALATVAQRRLVASPDEGATATWAKRALALAEQLDDEPVAVHALTTLAVAEIYPGTESGWIRLDEALQRAKAIGSSEAIVRALINFVEAARDLRRYDIADRYVDEAVAFLRDHEFDLFRHILGSRIASLALERGDWKVAEEQALVLLAETARSNQVRVRALEVIGRLRARRGERGAWAALDEGLAIVGPKELQEICPLRGARAEAAWLDGDAARAGDEAIAALEFGYPESAAWWLSELNFWAWRAGRIDRLPDGTEEGYVLHAVGRHRDAAEAWRAVGCPYQQAVALADSAEEADLREALGILHALDANALASQVTDRLRHLGARQIPRGPRPTTRANPARLSAREMEVLALIRDGARNSDIAERLVLSPKTIDHHVSAILRKLNVRNRDEALRVAHRLGLQDRGQAPPD
jgi:DNA-binding CsgD family transcriptional regulator